jgi:hypothetical protein
VLFKGRDGVLVRDRCILLCEQATQSMLKPHLPDSNEIKLSQQNITSACNFPNLSDRNMNVAIDFPSSVESIQGRNIHRSAPAFVNNHCQTEHMELNNNNCGCGCGILVAEFEGIKLDLVILQKKFEIESATERTNVSQLKRELAHEKDKNSRLESDLSLFVRERNAEVDELNETIALLNDRIKTSEAIIDQLRPSNASINLEETCTFDSAQSKDELVRKYPVCVDISTQTKNDDQKLSNNNAGQFCMSENAYVNLVRNDTAHSISQTRINKNVNANSSKHLVACPFLLKKGHCLKGSRCDFSHNISQSRTSKKASVNPLKEATEVSNDVVYPTTLNDSSVSTNSSAPNEMYAIPVRITTRRRGKRNPQKFRRRNSEHFLWDSGNPNRPPESKPESQLENHNSWKAYLQSVNQTLDQLGTLV